MLWICQALSPPKQRYSWARIGGRRPLPGVRRLKCPLSAGHIYELCRGKLQYLCYSLVPSAGGGGGANSRCITHECLDVYMYMVYMYMYVRRQFEAVPAYVMSQRRLRTRTFLTMPVKDAPRIENLLSQL